MYRTVAFSLALCALLACSSSTERSRDDGRFSDASGPLGIRHPLFRVTKSENDNCVMYDLLLAAPGRFAEEPLDVYWAMADGGEEYLNGFEQDLYGATIESLGPDRLAFRINGVDSKTFDVQLVAAAQDIQAYTTIDGQRAALTDIHLVIESTWNPFSPNVEVQLTGTSTEDQQTVTESIRN